MAKESRSQIFHRINPRGVAHGASPVATVEGAVASIDSVCEAAKKQIIAAVVAHAQAHPDNPWSGAQLVDLERTVKALYASWGQDIKGTFKKSLPKVMQEFVDKAKAEMKTAGREQHILGKPDTQRVQWHLNSSFDQVAMRTDKMAFDHIAQLRRISAEVIRTASLTGQTRKEVSRQLLNRAVTEIPGFQFIDNAGRKWKDKSYFEMLARTELMNAGRASYDDTCARNGFDVVMLTFSGHSCKACTEYEGHLFSLTGATPGLPTKDDLLDAGVFHPNCTHSYTAVSDYDRETGFDVKGNPLSKEEAEERRQALDRQNDDWLEAFDKKHQAEKNGVATGGNGGREDAAAQSAAKAEAEARAKAEEAARAKAEAEARAKEEAAAKAAAEARAKEEAEAKARAEEAAKQAAQAAEAARKAEEQAKQAEEAARKAAEEAARLEKERTEGEKQSKANTEADNFNFEKFIRELPDYPVLPPIQYDDEAKAKIEERDKLLDFIIKNSLFGSNSRTRKAAEEVGAINRWLDEQRVRWNTRMLSRDETLSPDSISFTVSDDNLKKSAAQACECLRKLIDKDKGLITQDTRFSFVQMTKEDKGREAYYSDTKDIHASKRSCISVMIHEMGHAIEYGNPRIQEMCKKFLKAHVLDDSPVRQLRKITGDENFEASEYAFDDHFQDRDVYAGKIYPKGATKKNMSSLAKKINHSNMLEKIESTEILSMGIENLVTDPHGFHERDALYYNFICHVLGNIRRN